MQPVAPTSDPRDWWQDLSKTPGKLWNSDVFATRYLWNHRYLEAAVPPAKSSCCSTIKELLKLLIWKLLPWAAEFVRHSCCTAPFSSAERRGWVWGKNSQTHTVWDAFAGAAPEQELRDSLTPWWSLSRFVDQQIHQAFAAGRLWGTSRAFGLPLEGRTGWFIPDA